MNKIKIIVATALVASSLCAALPDVPEIVLKARPDKGHLQDAGFKEVSIPSKGDIVEL